MANSFQEREEITKLDLHVLSRHDSRRSLKSLFLTLPLYFIGVIFIPIALLALFLNIKAIFSAIRHWKYGFFSSRAGLIINLLLLCGTVAFYIFVPLAIFEETGQIGW